VLGVITDNFHEWWCFYFSVAGHITIRMKRTQQFKDWEVRRTSTFTLPFDDIESPSASSSCKLKDHMQILSLRYTDLSCSFLEK
jgi:hypothetical protein